MKKKALSIVLMAAMLLGMTGCNDNGEKAPSGEPLPGLPGGEGWPPSVNEESEGSDEYAMEITDISTDITNEEPVGEIPVIKDEPSYFGNGYMVFSVDDKDYIYNIVEKNVIEYQMASEAEIIDINDSTAIFRTESGFEFLDSKTGDLLNSVNINNAELFGIYDEYIIVSKIEEKFSGNLYYLGVMNLKGEWVVPLSSELSICSLLTENGYDGDGKHLSKYIGEETIIYEFNYKNFLYSFATNKVYDLTDAIQEPDRIIYVDSNLDGSYADDGIIYIPTKNGMLVYDMATETYEYKEVTEEYWYESFSLKDELLIYKNTSIVANREYVAVFDRKLNKLAEYDLEEYDTIYRAEPYAYTSDKMAFRCKKDNTYYLGVRNADGSYVTEPFKPEPGVSPNVTYLTDELCFFDCGWYKYLLDFNTGEVTSFYDRESLVYPLYYDVKSNMFLAFSDGGYYLTTPSEPDVIINPFEH